MEAAKTLIRTAVRTFHDTRAILIIDALFIHSVLHAEELAILLGSQPKEVRKIINPLKACRLLNTHTRTEAKVGASSTRGIQREYYYIPFHPAIDAIKFRLTRLRKKVEQMYQQDEEKKDWRCPHCKAEFMTLDIVTSIGDDGAFKCLRCGHSLLETEQSNEPLGNHEKIRRLNIQLQRFDEIMLAVDKQPTPENSFFEAWERKKDVPRAAGAGQAVREYVAVSGSRRDERGRGAEQVDAKALSINLTSGAELDKEEEEKREARKAELAKQNQLPVWHTSSAIKPGGVGMKSEGEMVNGVFKKEEREEKKPDITMQSELEAYVAEMEREREEEDRKRAMEDAESGDGDDDDGDFEDVVSTSAMGTPSSSQQHLLGALMSGVKRDYDSESGPSSDANTPTGMAGTPASTSESGRAAKRVKFENGNSKITGSLEAKGEGGGDSDDDEDFEDAM